MTENKKVTFKHLNKGQEISGTEYGNHSSRFRAYVKDINPAYVTVAMWSPDGQEERLNAESMFLIEMTDEEIREKYNKRAGEIVQNIQTDLLRDQIGYHEMWNGWLSNDPWELAQACVDKKLTVLGHCNDIIPKTAMFSGDKLDIGICVEDEDGDKFWCHFRSADIHVLVRRYERYQEWLRKSKTDDIDDILFEVPIEIEQDN